MHWHVDSLPLVPPEKPSGSYLMENQIWSQGKTFNIHKKKFFFGYTAYGILVPQPEIEPVPPALEAQSLNQWTTGEVSQLSFLITPGSVGMQPIPLGHRVHRRKAQSLERADRNYARLLYRRARLLRQAWQPAWILKRLYVPWEETAGNLLSGRWFFRVHHSFLLPQCQWAFLGNKPEPDV